MSIEAFDPRHPNSPNQAIQNSPSVNSPLNNNVEEKSQYQMEIPLPSKGIFYYGDNYLKESITVRPLDWRDEDILTTPTFIEDLSVFDRILDNVILDKKLTAKDLVPVDRETILFWLRAENFGPKMTVPFKCPDCGKVHNIEYDFSSFSIPEYDEDVYEYVKQHGEYEIILPKTELKVLLRCPSYSEINKVQKKNISVLNTNKSATLTTDIIKLVVSGVKHPEIEGKIIRNKVEIEQQFNKVYLPISDSKFIRKETEKVILSYKTDKTIKCDCGYTREGVSLPINHQNFFWPEE